MEHRNGFFQRQFCPFFTHSRAVFLHGWMDNLGLFEPLISHLKRNDVEIFAADLPGHGFSDHVSWPWNYSHSELPKYVFEILERMNYTKYHYVGHSFSGSSITPSLAVSSDEVQSYTILDSHGVLTVRDDTYIKSQRENLEASYHRKSACKNSINFEEMQYLKA